MQIVSITNQKGGCGKTTTAVNLAAALAQNGKKILLVDLDPQAHATLGLNIKANLSMYNVLSKTTHTKASFPEIIQKVDTNFDIAPSDIILSTLEQELAGEIGRESRLWENIDTFRHSYDYVLIDCPPNLGLLTINAIRATGEIIVPVEASRFSLEGLNQLMEIIELVNDRLNHPVAYKILITNFDSRLRHSFKMLDKIKTTFAGKLYSTIVHVNVKLKEAQNEGFHIFGYDKYCRGAKDYFSLSREIITGETLSAVIKTEDTELIIKKFDRIAKEKAPKKNAVIFSIAAPDAKEVFITGDFNNWELSDKNKMELTEDGWIKELALPQGRHRYRFVMDGKWIEDPNNALKEVNPYGEMDSLIEVE